MCEKTRPNLPSKNDSPVGVIITVDDKTPARVDIGLVDEWQQAFELSDVNIEVLSNIKKHIIKAFMYTPLNNANLRLMASYVDQYMRENRPQLYTGRVKLGRWKYIDNEPRFCYIE